MATEKEPLEFEPIGIGEILKRYIAEVPKYQRDYAWTEAEVKTYLEDVSLAILKNEPQYFLGSIVTIDRENKKLEVVDGQQRLATTALIFAAMYHIAVANGLRSEKALHSFLFDIDSSNGSFEEEISLKLNVSDSAIFRELVLEGKCEKTFMRTRESHVLLKSAYEIAYSHIQDSLKLISSENYLDFYSKWITYFQQKIRVILLKVSNDSSAFKMFETLNDRGLNVSQSDLVKNYVFGQSDKKIDQAQLYWAGMRSTLESMDDKNSVMTFIWHSVILTSGFVEQKNIYDKIKLLVKGPSSAIEQLDTWEKLSQHYVALSNPESHIWFDYPKKLKSAIVILNLLNIQPFKPILLAASFKLNREEAAQVFEKMISVGVRLLIASRTTTQPVTKALSDAASRIWKGEISTRVELIDHLAASVPNDSTFKAAFEIANVPRARLARYYIRAIENANSIESEPWYILNDDPDAINLEHILPQKPLNNWPQFSKDEVDSYVQRIGNFALIQKKTNSDIKSDSFETKKPNFANSPYSTTVRISTYDEWTPAIILDRQKELADLALKAWPLK
jgi:uncharacterized protein with ParB-like and HNH nuclease domain